MNWSSWQAFWSMGGYGGYIWGAYGAVALVVFAEALAVRARLVRARRKAAATRKRA